MSYILKDKTGKVAISKDWDPSLFARLTNTSFPSSVSTDFVWEHEDFWLGWEDDPAPTPEQINAKNEELRAEAYRNESDPLFFKWQRGELDKQVWLDKISEIKARYPSNML